VKAIVIGGGIMGCATALELAKRGAQVEVLERAVPGAEASSAAAGILGAQLESGEHPEQLERFMAARDGYHAWASELEERSGVSVGYMRCGALRVAFHEEEIEDFAKSAASQSRAGARVELLDRNHARGIEPALGEDALGALHCPDEATVDPPRLLRALAIATVRAGVKMRSGTTVRSLIVENGRCTGVKLEDGEVRGDAIVLAAGSWSGLVSGAHVEVRPVRGQLVELDERPPSLRVILFSSRGYVVPRGDGRVVCGSTMENAGFRREVTAGGVHRVLDGALALAPRLQTAELVRSWSNFRPYSDAPLVGKSETEGLFLATGHHRNGILLAHATATTVADLVSTSR
jgi:glycine oxidase